ncbi:MAG: hypothetical protein A2600_06750 [Candidatus Lambdaproteobacteria bacterium RIFOXYD1_FULL_56_27]|uniref:Uncharacterized protein n=1 Tax=Candidatus Lambdaproteobacteria bacterium RIFOXYD2_FULL_56_26 TaxID=1817773 RepID=A0A1F6GL28_9PROT|nr:MAG: hypothetical protein A2557_13530 [Candidatus Lambdaproteobacteria bacterium RIFOXYD2_FULL_56_26]OGH04223.1 MAG: hypothetical protein A2426_02440 [Candidatus Lambdaproteobacteria bacterium RIFOXYC1_FULL_56_13]OGH08865.1 MAG: hypothetical protein A2600_06750 [Candidatus Lambdaproteobacteria bacterium RIFOXYD1_FULL_56_27]
MDGRLGLNQHRPLCLGGLPLELGHRKAVEGFGQEPAKTAKKRPHSGGLIFCRSGGLKTL